MAQSADIVAYPQKIIVYPNTQKVTVIGATEGPIGPQGPEGPEGPQGPPGDSSSATPGGTDGQVQYNDGGTFNGASALYYDDVNSRVGIGTTSPAYTLDVDGDINMRTGHSFYYDAAGATNPNPVFWIDGENTDIDIIRVGTDQFSTDSDYGVTLKYRGGGAGNENAFDIEMDNETGTQVTAMSILQDGKVGIGTTSPGRTLDVVQASSGATPYNLTGGIDIESSNITGLNVMSPNTGYGRIYFGAPVSATAGAIEYIHNATATNGYMKFRAGNADRMHILGNGNVGINDSTPSYTLDVNGTVRATGALYNNSVLVSNSASSYDKVRVWNSSSYSMGMVSGITYGHLGDYAMTFRMNSDNDRGFWWGDTSHTSSTGAMSLTTNGRLTVATSLSVGQGESITSPSTTTLHVNGDMSLRSGNGVHDPIYRVGGIYFTWDSDSYGTNPQHSIRSTNGDTWTDAITINSYGNIRMNIDSNGNGTNTFTVGRHTTGTANTLLTLDESGNLTVTGDLFATDIDVSGTMRANEFRADDYGPANDASFTFISDEDTGVYRHTTNQLGLSAGGSAGIIVASGTCVTASPATTTTSGYQYVLRNNTYGTLYRYSSTIELKEQVADFDGSGDLIDALRPVTFIPKFVAGQPTPDDEDDDFDPTVETDEQRTIREADLQYGLIAEEVATVGDGKLAQYEWTEDGQLKAMGWKWPDMIAVLIAEVKSLRARVATLEAHQTP